MTLVAAVLVVRRNRGVPLLRRPHEFLLVLCEHDVGQVLARPVVDRVRKILVLPIGALAARQWWACFLKDAPAPMQCVDSRERKRSTSFAPWGGD